MALFMAITVGGFDFQFAILDPLEMTKDFCK